MRCPYCQHPQDRVVDTREASDRLVIRRRRLCLGCRRRYTTYERIDEIPFMVVKKGDRREAFDRSKVLKGLLLACQKRPVQALSLEKIADEVEERLMNSPNRELTSEEIGRFLMDRLIRIDKVAYLRFASVYLEFDDLSEFMREIQELFEDVE
ncbi:MAG: transcriptional regulator NrdR [Acidobacteriota bacterium]